MAAGVVSAILAFPLRATGSSTTAAEPQVIDDSQLQALSTTVGDAAPRNFPKSIQLEKKQSHENQPFI